MTKRQLKKIERKETAKTLVSTHRASRLCNGFVVAITGATAAMFINVTAECIADTVEKRKAKKAKNKSAHCADNCMGEGEV